LKKLVEGNRGNMLFLAAKGPSDALLYTSPAVNTLGKRLCLKKLSRFGAAEDRTGVILTRLFTRFASCRLCVILAVCVDMWHVYVKTAQNHTPQAQVFFGRFHGVRHLSHRCQRLSDRKQFHYHGLSLLQAPALTGGILIRAIFSFMVRLLGYEQPTAEYADFLNANGRCSNDWHSLRRSAWARRRGKLRLDAAF